MFQLRLKIDTLVEVVGTAMAQYHAVNRTPVEVVTNHPSPNVVSTHSLDPFHPDSYHALSQHEPFSTFFIHAPHQLMDEMILAAMRGGTRPTLAQVPAAWVNNPTHDRFRRLTYWQQQRRLIVVSLNHDGFHPNVMLILFPQRIQRKYYMRTAHAPDYASSITLVTQSVTF